MLAYGVAKPSTGRSSYIYIVCIVLPAERCVAVAAGHPVPSERMRSRSARRSDSRRRGLPVAEKICRNTCSRPSRKVAHVQALVGCTSALVNNALSAEIAIKGVHVDITYKTSLPTTALTVVHFVHVHTVTQHTDMHRKQYVHWLVTYCSGMYSQPPTCPGASQYALYVAVGPRGQLLPQMLPLCHLRQKQNHHLRSA